MLTCTASPDRCTMALSPEASGAPSWAEAPDCPRAGRFLLGPELGQGGLGRVNLAWDPILKRKVALKRLYSRAPEQVVRLLREAQHQASLVHPHICPVHEVGADSADPYIAMRLVEGPTLSELRLQLNPEEAANILADVASALHVAHRAGLVHRDIKPQNILVERKAEGELHPFVVDFGLARDFTQADLTLSWAFSGTPAFMSPAQAAGAPATPSDDVFSLGATLYAVLSGAPPFEATSVAGLLERQAQGEPRSMRRLRPELPEDLDTITLACLAPEPQRRYPTAFDLESDLRRFLAGEPIQARPIGILGRSWRRIKRHLALSTAIASGAILALGLLGWNLHAGRQARIQVELAQRFGLQVREVEQMMRIERMLQPHDLRPAEAQVRLRMQDIRSLMARLGSVAQGPGHYALGRGHLVLREFPQARKELETSWEMGFRPPEAAFALGVTLTDLYLPEAGKFVRDLSKSELIHREFAQPALDWFARAKGTTQEVPAYGEAMVALLKRDFPACIRLSREAFASRPWMYEAKLLEARGWDARAIQAMGIYPEHRLAAAEGFSSIESARQAIDSALAIAPSDEGIYQEELGRLNVLSILQADSGTPDPALFDRTETLYPKALALRPDNLPLVHAWVYTRIRTCFTLLRTGQDARPLVRNTLALVPSDSPAARQAGLPIAQGLLAWILADGQFRRGGDPGPAFAAMDSHLPPGTFDRIQPQILRAEWLALRGQDPRPVFAELDDLFKAHAESNRSYFYFHQLQGMADLTRAEWEFETGQDPLPRLAQAAAHLKESRRINPEVVYPCFFLARVEALKAQRALAKGRNPRAPLEAGLAFIREGSAISRSHHLLHHAQALLRLLQARDAADPAPALAQARDALGTAFAINATDYRLHRVAVQVELLAMACGQSPDAAEAAVRRGLASKPDDPWLHLALAQAARARGPAHRDAARTHLRRALALHPGFPEALAEQARLSGSAP